MNFLRRQFATKVKAVPVFEKDVIENIENGLLKARKHPGRLRTPTFQVPERLFKAIKEVVRDYSIKSLVNDGAIVTRYLKERFRPAEKQEIKATTEKLKERVENKYNVSVEKLNEKQFEGYKKKVTEEVLKSLLKHIYVWAPTDFSGYLCFPYLVSRSAAEYAIIRSIFTEISERDPKFQPSTIFDFGSGVGTVIWASQSVWEDSISEYFCVDSSSKMNEISKQILQDGKVEGKLSIKAQVYYRQFLPSSRKTQYNIVTCAFSLLELPDSISRLETVLNLWHKTSDYLVLVELGSKAGFQVVNEARDYILNHFRTSRFIPVGHVFSPCPHDELCPKSLTPTSPCLFENLHFRLPLDGKLHAAKETYSYVVIKKGERDLQEPRWPRIVQPVLKKSKHSICRLCTMDGKLEEIIFTASKHGKFPYWCARSSKWGDRLPISISKGVVVNSNKHSEKTSDENSPNFSSTSNDIKLDDENV